MITPELALNFTTATLDARITVTRTGNTATVTNSSGLIALVNADLPRFNYSPTTLACNGLLIEEARTNISTYSELIGGGTWLLLSVNYAVQTLVGTSPDGTSNATNIYAVVSGSPRWVYKQFTYSANQAYVLSVYAKSNSKRWFCIYNPTGAGPGAAWFDLTNGVVGTAASGFTSSIFNAGNGWYRCSITWTAPASGARYFAMSDVNADSSTTTTASGTSGVLVYGAQVELGAFPTSYIPTVAATVTRNADVATITGSNFTSFWNSVQGGASVQATPSIVSGVRPLVQFDDNTANEIIALRGNTTNPELYIVDGGTPQAQLDAGTIAANTAYSLTGWWATNDCKARKDSGAVVTDITATIPTVTQMRIGSDGTDYLNGTIATIGYYDSFFGRPIYTRRKNKVFPSLF